MKSEHLDFYQSTSALFSKKNQLILEERAGEANVDLPGPRGSSASPADRIQVLEMMTLPFYPIKKRLVSFTFFVDEMIWWLGFPHNFHNSAFLFISPFSACIRGGCDEPNIKV
ncbi:hypothetical protein ACH5RR_002261 [Cinchona calisaya]|uniref:Uncharacterized protein n=1 Tax=Cinchona calisaya TaxID=153742 RepID=A0ABD3B6C6_9GENT